MDIKQLKEVIENNKIAIKEAIQAYWENERAPFLKPDDVPDLPIVDREKWNSYYVPILIERGAIPKDKLIVGKTYLGSCRNSETATWDGKVFNYKRYKFGTYYPDTINHFQDDDGYDLFVPIKEL